MLRVLYLFQAPLLICACSISNNRSQYLISTDQLWHLMRAFASGQHPFNSLAPGVQKEVVAGLLACATGPQKDQYLNEVWLVINSLL